jgi:hypothetical protein
MDFRMTLRALCQKGLFHRVFCRCERAALWIERGSEIPFNARQLRVEVHRVASQTKKRLVLNEQVVCDGTVGLMTNAAILVHRLMFKDERPLFCGMARETKIAVIAHDGELHRSTVDRVTVRAFDESFDYRMVRWELGPGTDVPMAVEAESGVRSFQESRRIGVNLVAIGAAAGNFVVGSTEGQVSAFKLVAVETEVFGHRELVSGRIGYRARIALIAVHRPGSVTGLAAIIAASREAGMNVPSEVHAEVFMTDEADRVADLLSVRRRHGQDQRCNKKCQAKSQERGPHESLDGA